MQELSEQKRRLTVEMRKLRDPGHLTHLARDDYYALMEDLGLVRLRNYRELDVFYKLENGTD